MLAAAARSGVCKLVMNRSTFACIVLFAAAAIVAPQASAGVEEEAVKKMIIEWYAAYAAGNDETHYRTFLADDYLLCEHGELVDLEGDVAMLTKNRGPGFQRKDQFDFKSVTVRGDIAYTVYFLESDLDDDKMKRHRKWLESAVLRRIDGRWRAALLHSTKIVSTDTVR
jgi:ketosteroid isomerase-like protein